MRKIHKLAIENLMAGKDGRVGARDRIEGKEWFYHASPIVKVDDTGIYVNWHGYYTYTTNMRIYALCAYLGVPVPEKKKGYIKVV